MKYKSEVKIGLTGIFTLIVIIWGINFLKGRNLLNNTYKLTAEYERIDGLENSAAVILNGFKIGSVSDIQFETKKTIPFTVILEIDKRYPIESGSIAEIYSADLLGSKSIRILSSGKTDEYQPGDAIKTSVKEDLISSLIGEIEPLKAGVTSVIETLDSTGRALNAILGDPSVKQLIMHLEKTSAALENKMSEKGDVTLTLKNLKDISESLSNQTSAIESSISNIASISGELKDAHLDSLIHQLTLSANNISAITSAIESGEGSIGKLVNSDSLYLQINTLVKDLDILVNDITENPKKYVSISLIGK